MLDVMHCKKNLCENIMKMLLSINDSSGNRMDVEELGFREEI